MGQEERTQKPSIEYYYHGGIGKVPTSSTFQIIMDVSKISSELYCMMCIRNLPGIISVKERK